MQTSEPPGACLELGARKAPAGRLGAWHCFERLQQAGCYSRLARNFSQSIWCLKAIVDPDLNFPGHNGTLKPQTVGGLGGLFCMGALQADGGCSSLLLSGGINDGVAESHRRVAISRGPAHFAPRTPQCARLLLHRPRAALFCFEAGE